MHKAVLVTTVVGAAVIATIATPHATFAASSDTQDNTKVTICHRTDSITNPYVKITVSSSAAYGGHDDEHNGPVATNAPVAAKLKSQHTEWGDIIPADATHAGKNWTTEGRAVYDNGCGCIDKSGPIVGPLNDMSDTTSKSDNCQASASKSATPPSRGEVVTPAAVATPVATAQLASTTVTPAVAELPHTGASNGMLMIGAALSFLTGLATYAGRFIRSRLIATL